MGHGHSANSGSSLRQAEYDGETEAQPGTLTPKVLHRDVLWAGLLGWGRRRQPLTGNFVSLSTGHGNHRESSPFLCPLEASRGNDYYDRNLALFEVAEEPFWAISVAGRWE